MANLFHKRAKSILKIFLGTQILGIRAFYSPPSIPFSCYGVIIRKDNQKKSSKDIAVESDGDWACLKFQISHKQI